MNSTVLVGSQACAATDHIAATANAAILVPQRFALMSSSSNLVENQRRAILLQRSRTLAPQSRQILPRPQTGSP
jgi:hypothetical protein